MTEQEPNQIQSAAEIQAGALQFNLYVTGSDLTQVEVPEMSESEGETA